jgi:hypothetical protein
MWQEVDRGKKPKQEICAQNIFQILIMLMKIHVIQSSKKFKTVGNLKSMYHCIYLR